MSLPAEIELLFELSLAIGDSTELEPMLQRFLVDLQRLLDGSGGAILQVQQQGLDVGTTPDPIVCTVPQTLPRTPCYDAFWKHWSTTSLYETLSQRPNELPLVSLHDDCVVHAFRLPGFGILLFLKGRRSGQMSNRMQHAFVALARKLGNAANACLYKTQMRRQNQRLELARASAGIGVWEWDLTSGRLHWDGKMRQLFGITDDTFGGTCEDWLSRIHPADVEGVQCTLDRLAKETSETEVIQFRATRPDSQIRYLRGQATLIRSPAGEPLRMAGICMDVTESKLTESALRQARDLAEAANRGRNLFVSGLTDQIQSPLSAILEMTALTLDSDLNSIQRDRIERIKSAGETLVRVIDDLVDFSRIDAGEVQIQSIPFNLPIMVAEALKPLAMQAEDKGLVFVEDVPEDLPQYHLGDPGRIRQVLTSLVSTAIDLTDRGEIRTQMSYRADPGTKNDEIQLSILSDGIKIPANDLRQLIDALDSAPPDARTQRPDGTGFRLAMAGRLIERLGGRLWLDAHPERSTTFFIALNLPRTKSPEIHRRTRQTWQDRRALIVERHALTRRTLGYWLHQWGFATQEAIDAQQALQHIHEAVETSRPFDVMLTDASLPGMDGYALIQQLSSKDLIGHTKIVLIASGPGRGDAQRCRALGIPAFLTKPTLPDQLHEVLSRLLDPGEGPPTSQLLTRYDLLEQRQRLRILLAEHKALDRKLAESLLGQWGHAVTSVEDGPSAIERFAPLDFDLILLSMQIPGTDYLETAQALKAKEEGVGSTPIIAMSANALESDRMQCLEAGLDEHIAKPIEPRILQDLIQRFTLDQTNALKRRSDMLAF
ncbi:response regulator [Thiorhodococcus fuscus]|uniref:histidine kinase n=1 Tax=Thiorhodococcus fuscus TaxID=527200 RepID=A0ABW4Y5E9_9GAMM